VLGSLSSVGKLFGGIVMTDTNNEAKAPLGGIGNQEEKISTAMSIFNSTLDNSSAFFDIFSADTSISDKFGAASSIAGEDTAVGKILSKMATLSENEQNIVGFLSMVGDAGLPEEHIEGILNSQK